MDKFDFDSFGIKPTKVKRLGSIFFAELNVVPPQSEKFYQLILDGEPTGFVYSKSHLFKCFEGLNVKFDL